MDDHFFSIDSRRDFVPAAGERIKLVEAGNHAQGCIFQDGKRLWSSALEERINEISRKLNGFLVGRYDIRFASENDLRNGENFRLIELNGAPSEATNIYDRRNSLFFAYRMLFKQWDLVFTIGAANRKRGATPTNPTELWRAWRKTATMMESYPVAD